MPTSQNDLISPKNMITSQNENMTISQNENMTTSQNADYKELERYYEQHDDQSHRQSLVKPVYKEKLGKYEPELDALNYKLGEVADEENGDDESGLNQSMEVPLEYFNLDIQERCFHLRFWKTRKQDCETMDDYYDELAEMVSDLAVKGRILDNRFEHMQKKIFNDLEFVEEDDLARLG